MTELSEKAINICNQNYDNNCGNCELRPICCSPVGSNSNYLDNWTNEVNKLADLN